MQSRRILMLAAVAALSVTGASRAATLYADNFDVDHTANWTVNKSTGVNANDAGSAANFFFDYSTVGIPSAPNSGGSTTGLKLEANKTGAIFSGLSVSPNGQSFSGDYRLRFDAWLNSVGPFPAGGSGSTQVTSWGIGTAGSTAQWAGGAQDSVHFGATAEGGSSVDYRAYSSASPTGYVPASGVFAAGTSASPDSRNDADPYYATFGSKTPPAAQTGLFASQTGTTSAGSAGMAWRDVIVEKNGNSITWTMDGKLLATVDASTVTLGGGNILLGQYDINATSTSTSGLIFGLIDNVRVDSVVPEPATAALLGLAGLTMLARRRRA